MQNNSFTILGIDPGYDRCGAAIVSVSGNKETLIHSECVLTSKNEPQEKRLAQVYAALETLINTYKPTHLAMETLFFSVNKKTALKVAEARGAILALCGKHSLDLVELSPQAVKLAMTGSGSSDKKAVEKMVSLTLKIDVGEKIDDEVDAIAVAYASIGSIAQKNLK